MTLIGVKEYNSKVDIHGRYLPYSGWSTISFIEDGHDRLNLIGLIEGSSCDGKIFCCTSRTPTVR